MKVVGSGNVSFPSSAPLDLGGAEHSGAVPHRTCSTTTLYYIGWSGGAERGKS